MYELIINMYTIINLTNKTASLRGECGVISDMLFLYFKFPIVPSRIPNSRVEKERVKHTQLYYFNILFKAVSKISLHTFLYNMLPAKPSVLKSKRRHCFMDRKQPSNCHGKSRLEWLYFRKNIYESGNDQHVTRPWNSAQGLRHKQERLKRQEGLNWWVTLASPNCA